MRRRSLATPSRKCDRRALSTAARRVLALPQTVALRTMGSSITHDPHAEAMNRAASRIMNATLARRTSAPALTFARGLAADRIGVVPDSILH